MALGVEDSEAAVEGDGVLEALRRPVKVAAGDTELEGVPVDAAEPVNSEEGDTELLAQRV